MHCNRSQSGYARHGDPQTALLGCLTNFGYYAARGQCGEGLGTSQCGSDRERIALSSRDTCTLDSLVARKSSSQVAVDQAFKKGGTLCPVS